ncbi:MAG TPA: MerR family transcriptional regulator [Clostridiales bacterium]|nr:MerR family transcriptional regulator [Clostridiales bacterium]
MPGQYKIKDIENMLGVTRDAIRYYSKKGLIEIDKNNQNGYRIFDDEDIFDILDISYYRKVLDMNISDISKCVSSKSFEEYLTTIKKHQNSLEEQLRKTEQKIEIIKYIRQEIEWFSDKQENYEIIDAPSGYLFPEKYLYDIHSNIFRIGWPVSCFKYNNDRLCHTGTYTFAVVSPDTILLNEQELSAKEYLPGGKYLRFLFVSEKEINDPALIEPILIYAKEHGFGFFDCYYLTCCFSFKNNHARKNYYEASLRLK